MRQRLMRVHAIQCLPQKKRWQKKGSSKRPECIANHLARDFKSLETNRKWVSDITYIRTAEHWLYLCVVIDLYSGIVIG
jgi:putative transposase